MTRLERFVLTRIHPFVLVVVVLSVAVAIEFLIYPRDRWQFVLVPNLAFVIAWLGLFALVRGRQSGRGK